MRITLEEVDVAALSVTRRKIEGYECKVSSAAFEHFDCTNLSGLIQFARNKEYRVNAGFVALENDQIMKIKLAKLNLPDIIKVYGLDSLENLHMLPYMDD